MCRLPRPHRGGCRRPRVDDDVKQRLRDLRTAKLDEWRAIYRELQQSEHLDPDADMDSWSSFSGPPRLAWGCWMRRRSAPEACGVGALIEGAVRG